MPAPIARGGMGTASPYDERSSARRRRRIAARTPIQRIESDHGYLRGRVGTGDLIGRYRLLGRIGSGGMGTVWRARDELLGREVAVKEVRLPPELDADGRAEACARAVREAQAASRVAHPDIVTVHDVLAEGGVPWIVMRLLEGRPLSRVLRDGPLPPRQVAALGLRVLDALSTAHAQGVLHRDVKPANIFVMDGGAPVLADFGIARVDGQATLTRAGLMIGSLGYIAPERLRDQPPSPSADLWSLAATLYEAVEGGSPYPAQDGAGVIARVLTEPPLPPRSAGPLGPLLVRALALEPAGRPNAEALRAELTAIANGPDHPALRRIPRIGAERPPRAQVGPRPGPRGPCCRARSSSRSSGRHARACPGSPWERWSSHRWRAARCS